jgi:hypothetical protein
LEATMNARNRSHLTLAGTVFVLVFALGLLFSAPVYADAPGNDSFAGATEIFALPYSDWLNTWEATGDPADPVCGGSNATVWYRYTPTYDMTLSIATWGGYSATDYDTSLSIHAYDGTSFTTEACAANSWEQPLVFDVTAWTTYYIMVSAWGPGGNLYLSVQELLPPPANDDFDTPVWIGELPYYAGLDTSTATTAYDDPYCAGNGASVWYAFYAETSMRLEADTYGSNYDTTLSVWTGQRATLQQIACNDDWNGLQSYVSFDVAAGVTYYIMVGRFGSGSGGDMQLHVQEVNVPPPPPNDDFDNATVITGLPYSETLDVSAATRAGDDPYSSCGGWDHSVWYAFTPAETMWLEADPYGGTYDVSIAVYSGPRGGLTEAACRSDWYMGEPLRFLAQGGTTYYFMLSPTWYDTWVTLNLRAGPTPPSNDDFDNATVIEALPFSDTVDVSLATWSGDDPYPSCGASPFTIWYAFTPSETMWLETDWYDGSYSAIAVFTGQRGSLTEVACRSDWYYGESLRFAAQGGVTYYFMVSSPWGGSVTLNVRYGASPPPNDDFDSATVITALPFSESVDMRYATNAWDDPFCATPYGPSIWYQFTAASSARLELTMNSYGTIGLYSGSRGALDELACANYWDGPLFFEAEAGRTYYISISASLYESALAVTLQEALAVSVTIDPTGTFDMKAGTATVSGTVTCSRPVTMHLQIQMTQPVGRVSTIIAGTILWEFSCDGTTPWSVTLTPQSGKFAGGQATVTVSAQPYPYPSVEATASITLNRASK